MSRHSSFLLVRWMVFASSVWLHTSAAHAQTVCQALPPPAGRIIDVTPAQAASLPGIVAAAQPGETIRLADGTYRVPQTLDFSTQGVTLRSASGNRHAAIIDGQYAIGDVLALRAANLTIADVTVTRSYYHPVHVTPRSSSTTGTLLHNLRVVDGAEQFIKINPANGYYAEYGVVRCSSLEMTDAGRGFVRNNCYTGGVDGHQARGWSVYGNTLSGFWCAVGLSEHAIHFWTGSRDTVIDSNVIVNSARGIGLGLGQGIPGRSYADQPCSGRLNLGHYGGRVTNNFVMANDPRLFSSNAGFDTGIALEEACGAAIVHNTVAATAGPRSSSIEWRFPNTSAIVLNNLVMYSLRARDGGVANLQGNVPNAPLSIFVDPSHANLHLLATAALAIDKGVVSPSGVSSDIDGSVRTGPPDVGADEFVGGAFALAASPSSSGPGAQLTVTWQAPVAGASDWIGLYAVGAPDSAALNRQFTLGAANGTFYSSAPLSAGAYEFRYLAGDPPVATAASNRITVTSPPSPAPLSVTTSALLNARRNKGHQQTLSATGGVAPYAWSVVSGSVPSGLTLNSATGTITGRPTTAGTWSFTVRVQDSQNQPASASRALAITVTK